MVNGKLTVNGMTERLGMVGGLVPPANAADHTGTHNVYYVIFDMSQLGTHPAAEHCYVRISNAAR